MANKIFCGKFSKGKWAKWFFLGNVSRDDGEKRNFRSIFGQKTREKGLLFERKRKKKYFLGSVRKILRKKKIVRAILREKTRKKFSEQFFERKWDEKKISRLLFERMRWIKIFWAMVWKILRKKKFVRAIVPEENEKKISGLLFGSKRWEKYFLGNVLKNIVKKTKLSWRYFERKRGKRKILSDFPLERRYFLQPTSLFPHLWRYSGLLNQNYETYASHFVTFCLLFSNPQTGCVLILPNCLLQCIYGCYVHSAVLPTFHRRCYWLLQVNDTPNV